MHNAAAGPAGTCANPETRERERERERKKERERERERNREREKEREESQIFHQWGFFGLMNEVIKICRVCSYVCVYEDWSLSRGPGGWTGEKQ